MPRRKQPEPQATWTARAWLRAPSALVVAGLFLTLSLALYWGSLRHPLVFDDRLLHEDFLRFYGTSWFKLDLRWLSYATFGWTYDVFGKAWWWFRLGNVLLHAATAVMLFAFLARLFELALGSLQPAAARGTLPARCVAFFGALAFLLHPVAVYGVAYLTQRSIVMATLFSLVSLKLFLEGLARRSLPWYVGSVAAYFLAVFSKEHAVMLPAVAAALAILTRGMSVRLLRELFVPYALFAAIALLVVLRAKGYLGTPYEPLVQDLVAQMRGSQPAFDTRDAFALSVVNQGFLFFRYLLLWLVPYPGWMSIDLRPAFPTAIWAWPQTSGFAIYLAYPVVAAVLLRKGGVPGLLGFGLLFPWLLALTEFATVRIQEPFVLYRSYLWMSGLPAILPALLHRVAAKWSVTIAAIACAALIPPAQDRIASFSSGLRLWDDVVRKNTDVRAPFAERGYHNRGLAYLQEKRYAEALRDFNQAIEINARDADAYMGRGTLFGRTGRSEQALIELDRAIEIDPRYAEAYAKRCFTKMMLDRPREALPDCEKAVALDPRHRDAYTNLGVVYAALGKVEDAAGSYRRALALDAGNGDANYNYGVLLAVTGRPEEARYHLTLGCEARVAASCDLLSRMRRAP